MLITTSEVRKSHGADGRSSFFPCDIGISSEPFLVDLDKEPGDKAHEGIDNGEAPDFSG